MIVVVGARNVELGGTTMEVVVHFLRLH